jgi:hypothetical protein
VRLQTCNRSSRHSLLGNGRGNGNGGNSSKAGGHGAQVAELQRRYALQWTSTEADHSDGAASRMSSPLEELPQHIILEILHQLDVASLCSLAQTCRVMLRFASKDELWCNHMYMHGSLPNTVRLSLSQALHLPPQVCCPAMRAYAMQNAAVPPAGVLAGHL